MRSLNAGKRFSGRQGSCHFLKGQTVVRKVDVPEREEEMRLKEESDAVTQLVAPAMDDLPVRSYHPGRLLTFFANALPAGVTYSLVSGPGNVNATTGQFSWTPPLTQTGAVTVTIRATNASGSDQKSTTLNRANQSPAMDALPDRTAHPGRLLSFTATAVDADGDAITFSLVSGPGIVNAQTGQFTWTPPFNQTSSVQVTIRASDCCGDSCQQSCTITMSNQAPFIDFLPDRQGAVGSLLQFHVNAFDPDNDGLQFIFVGQPPQGATLDNTGLFSWTPAGGQNGTWTITVQVTDSCGATYQRQFTVTVP